MNKYDIVIVGGGTSGVSCAWNAGRLGFKTLLIEKNSFLGGSITSSLVIPAMKTCYNSINNDFFNELYKSITNYMGVDIPETPVFMRVLMTFIKIYGDL